MFVCSSIPLLMKFNVKSGSDSATIHNVYSTYLVCNEKNILIISNEFIA